MTYDKPVSGEEAKKYLANFRKRLQRLAKKLDVEAKYIVVTEIGGKNKIHHHIIIHTSRNIIKISHIRDIWKNGFVKIKLYGGLQYKILYSPQCLIYQCFFYTSESPHL